MHGDTQDICMVVDRKHLYIYILYYITLYYIILYYMIATTCYT